MVTPYPLSLLESVVVWFSFLDPFPRNEKTMPSRSDCHHPKSCTTGVRYEVMKPPGPLLIWSPVTPTLSLRILPLLGPLNS